MNFFVPFYFYINIRIWAAGINSSTLKFFVPVLITKYVVFLLTWAWHQQLCFGSSNTFCVRYWFYGAGTNRGMAVAYRSGARMEIAGVVWQECGGTNWGGDMQRTFLILIACLWGGFCRAGGRGCQQRCQRFCLRLGFRRSCLRRCRRRQTATNARVDGARAIWVVCRRFRAIAFHANDWVLITILLLNTALFAYLAATRTIASIGEDGRITINVTTNITGWLLVIFIVLLHSVTYHGGERQQEHEHVVRQRLTRAQLLAAVLLLCWLLCYR